MSGLAAFHDVVAVNMNYRTGPIGWMAFEADVNANRSTGNFGILDIQARDCAILFWSFGARLESL